MIDVLLVSLLACALGCDRDPAPEAPPPTTKAPATAEASTKPPVPRKADDEADDADVAPAKIDAGSTAPAAVETEAADEGALRVPKVDTKLDFLPPSTRVVEVGRDAITLRGKEVVPLDAGRLTTPKAVVRHTVTALDEALAAAPAIKEPHLAVLADAHTPAETVLDVVHTVGPHAFGEIGLVAEGPDGRRGLVALSGIALGKPREDPSASSPALVVTIYAGGFRLWDMGEEYPEPDELGVRTTDGTDPFAAWDYPALTDRARAHAREYGATPGEAALSPEPDVPWAVVVRSIAAMRGPECAARTCILPRAVLIGAGQIARGRADVEPLGGPSVRRLP